jgi:hypothetical protein
MEPFIIRSGWGVLRTALDLDAHSTTSLPTQISPPISHPALDSRLSVSPQRDKSRCCRESHEVACQTTQIRPKHFGSQIPEGERTSTGIPRGEGTPPVELPRPTRGSTRHARRLSTTLYNVRRCDGPRRRITNYTSFRHYITSTKTPLFSALYTAHIAHYRRDRPAMGVSQQHTNSIQTS